MACALPPRSLPAAARRCAGVRVSRALPRTPPRRLSWSGSRLAVSTSQQSDKPLKPVRPAAPTHARLDELLAPGLQQALDDAAVRSLLHALRGTKDLQSASAAFTAATQDGCHAPTHTRVACAALEALGRLRGAGTALELYRAHVQALQLRDEPPPSALTLAALRVCARAGSPRLTRAAGALHRELRSSGALTAEAYALLIAARADPRGRKVRATFRFHDALGCWEEMLSDGVAPDSEAYEAIISVCASCNQPDQLQLMLGEAQKGGVQLSRRSYERSLKCLAACGRLRPALAVVVAWRSAASHSALAPPGAPAYAAAMAACAAAPSSSQEQQGVTLSLAWDILAELHSQGLSPDRDVYHALMDCALATRQPASAFDARADMVAQGISASGATWARLVAAASLRGAPEAEALLEEMEAEGHAPGAGCYTSALLACARSGDGERAERLVAKAGARGVLLDAPATAARLGAGAGRGAAAVAAMYGSIAPASSPLGRDRRLLGAALKACFGASSLQDGALGPQEGASANAQMLMPGGGVPEALQLLRCAVASGVVPRQADPPVSGGTACVVRLDELTRVEAAVTALGAVLSVGGGGGASLQLLTGASGGADAARKRAAAVQSALTRAGVAWQLPQQQPGERMQHGACVSAQQLSAFWRKSTLQ